MMNANGTLSPVPHTLSTDDLRRLAPSVFATRPWERMSHRYRQVPTSQVVDLLRDKGFHPTRAQQSYTRLEGKRGYAKHLLRFRHEDYLRPLAVGDEIPEIVLLNSHDGSSAYKLYAGIFRLACLNGLIVAMSEFAGIAVRHSGGDDFERRILDATDEIVSETPRTMETIARWKALPLTRHQQQAFAEGAAELRDSRIVGPSQLLVPRRREDATALDGTRDLWRTFNTVQEHMLKGGDQGRASTGRRTTTRPVKSVQEDTRLNKALWTLAARLAETVG